MYRRITSWLLIVAIYTSANQALAKCTLELSAIGAFGEPFPLNQRRIQILNTTSRAQVEVTIPGSQHIDVECGHYEVSLVTSVFSIRPQSVTLPGPDNLNRQRIVFGVNLYAPGNMNNPNLVLKNSGRWEGDSEEIVYSLIPIFAGETSVQRASRAGTVVFQYIAGGRYLLRAEHRGKVAFVEDIGEVNNAYKASIRTKAGDTLTLIAIPSEVSGNIVDIER